MRSENQQNIPVFCYKSEKHINITHMKKYVLAMLAMMMTVMSGFAFDKYSVDRSDLPEAAREFISTYFPKAKVGMIKTDKHLLKKTDYDVKLVNGTMIEFNNSGKWTSVDCKGKEVPQEIIPKSIRNYVKKNFQDVKIVRIEKTTTKYEIGLSDDVELTFNLLGQFKGIKMDD